MAPFVDMVNHSFSSNAFVAWAQPGQITLKAKKWIPGYNEVLINYGEKSNVELMSAYGFTVPSNPHDSIEITLSESADEDVGVSTPSLLSVLGVEGDIEKGHVRVINNRVMQGNRGVKKERGIYCCQHSDPSQRGLQSKQMVSCNVPCEGFCALP